MKAARAIALAADQTGNEAPTGNLPAAHEGITIAGEAQHIGQLARRYSQAAGIVKQLKGPCTHTKRARARTQLAKTPNPAGRIDNGSSTEDEAAGAAGRGPRPLANPRA